jgi:hypothetical protein
MLTFAGRVCCAFTLLAASAAPPPTTEDGIRAMLRGEYQAAARILRPLAEDPEKPDPVAQFFLAFLYATGQGVGGDPPRACGLFKRAAGRVHPFTDQSSAIATLMSEQLGGGASIFCVAEESWRGGPPQSFNLGPDHRIVFADTSITVTYGDKEERTSLLPLSTPFLPIQHTVLDVTRPTAGRRHFFQWFRWTPNSRTNPSSWTLGWTLMEVVGDQLFIPVASEKSLVVVDGATPPVSYDPSSVVRLRVNRSGEAEFTIDSETGSRTKVIAPRESR